MQEDTRSRKAICRPTKHAVYVVYLNSSRIPRYYHKTLNTAIGEATRLSKELKKDAFVIEYGEEPLVLGHVKPSGEIIQKQLAAG